MAPKRRKTQNGEGETSDSPPPAEEETGGETSSPRAPNEEETGKEVPEYSCGACGVSPAGQNYKTSVGSNRNANFGCNEIISYLQFQKHTQQCEFGSSDCAIPECAKMVIPDEQGEETISGEIQREDPPQPSQEKTPLARMERIQEERPKRKRKEKVQYTPSTR